MAVKERSNTTRLSVKIPEDVYDLLETGYGAAKCEVIRQALRIWFDAGCKIDSDFLTALGSGSKTAKRKVTIRARPYQIDQLNKLSEEYTLTKSHLVRGALGWWLRQNEG